MEATAQQNIEITTENSYTHINDDYMRGYQVYRWILAVGVIPVCFLGLGANTVSVWVWNANRKHNIMARLFQCLGVADNLFLLLTVVRSILYHRNQFPRAANYYMFPLLLFFQTLSVHVTVIVAAFRWLGVSRPQLMQRVTHCRIILTCVGLAVWSALLTSLQIVTEALFDSHQTEYRVMMPTLQVVMLILPNLVLLGFSIALLTVTCQRQNLLHTEKHTKMTAVVLSIAGCSLLSCIVGETGKLLAAFKDEIGITFTIAFTFFGVGMLAQVLNSSVNFLFYFFVASRFRDSLQQSLCCFFARFRNTQSNVSTTTSTGVSTDPEAMTLQQHENKTKHTDQDLTEATASI